MSTDTALGQRLVHADGVLVRMNDIPAGGGMTPSGLWIEHSERLPAIFGEVLACGTAALAFGVRPGMFVLFVRYAGEITDEHDDGTVYAVFSMHDLLAEIPREALRYSDADAARLTEVR